MRKALITGFTGQDGSYLAKLLLSKGYEVYGMVRRSSHEDWTFVNEMGLEDVQIVEGDLADSSSLNRLIMNIKPDEVYNLAAQSHVATSFNQPEFTVDITGMGVLRLLEAIRTHYPKARFYQASSSEMFGDVKNYNPQNETTELRPRSPYAAAKVLGHHIVKVYRESYGIYACSGILFNHESPRRGAKFVTRKITDYVARYNNGLVNEPLLLGNIYAQRDWGSAEDYVEAMWLMLQQDIPNDYVIGTGETHSVKDFIIAAFSSINVALEWEGQGVEERAINADTDEVVVQIDKEFYRPAEVNRLLSNASKAIKDLNWQPSTTFNDLVEWMVESDINKYYEVKNANPQY